MKDLYEINVFILEACGGNCKNQFKIMLQHPNGDQEISDQTFGSRAEAEAAVMQYAKDRDGTMNRLQ